MRYSSAHVFIIENKVLMAYYFQVVIEDELCPPITYREASIFGSCVFSEKTKIQ
jgi:hypothetical protein